jgi:glycosyltransferase involved in cell wall biosynthesis
MERLVEELGLSASVSFLGSQEYVEDILPVADAFLLPSLHESFGLAVLEAMAVGVPVVATSRGGLPEVVIDGVSGYLRDPQDVEGMSEALIRLLEDPELSRSVAEAGIHRSREAFHPDRVVPEYLRVYQEGP